MIPEPGEGWARLDPRKLLLDPVKVLGQFLVPVAVALFGVSRSDSFRGSPPTTGSPRPSSSCAAGC